MIAGQTYYWRVDETTDVINKGTVWSFTTVPNYPVTDETLIGHWDLDGPNAAVMADSSGHGLHAEIVTPGGSVEWIDGPVGGAIELDGLSDIRTLVDVNDIADVNTNTVTITAWVKVDVQSLSRGWGLLQETGRRVGLQLGGGSGNSPTLRWPNANFGSSTLQLIPSRWAFVAAVVEPAQATLYLDGKNNTEIDPTPHDPVYFDRAMEIGTDGSGYGTRFIGALDDLRFYARALTADEIEQLMQAGTPPMGEEDPLVVDNFDGYRVWDYQTSPNVWDVWLDGWDDNTNGAISGNLEEPYMELGNPAEATGVALPLNYDNTVATLSEITRTFNPAQDLTREGATSLVIWVRGPIGITDPGDDVYVKLSDGTTEYYQELTTAEEVINLAEGTPVPWKKVTIAVSDLTIDPTNLTSMTIGVGNPAAPQNGGNGVVFIDNIGLE